MSPLSKERKAQYMRDRRERVKSVPVVGEQFRYHVLPKMQGERIPLYNPAIHRAGDKVRMITGEVYIIPDLDADGNKIGDVS